VCVQVDVSDAIGFGEVRTGRLVGVFLLEQSLTRVQGWDWLCVCEWVCE
jgi:hypothetical protein